MVRGSQNRTFEGRLRKLRLVRLGREGSEGMYSLSTAGDYKDKARLFSGMPSKRMRGNGHRLQKSDMWRTLLRKSGQTLESLPTKVMGSPALEIRKTQLDKAMSNLVLTFNSAIFQQRSEIR